MANCISFSDFPEDVQLCILSFLTPSDLSSFACTSKRFGSLCHGDSRFWYAMCDRRWGSDTQIQKWGDGKVSFKLLYKTLSEFENLIGFWRRSGAGTGTNPGIIGNLPLVFFEWGVSCVTGSRVSPSKDGTYDVIKSPFIWLSLSSQGQPLIYVKTLELSDKECRSNMDVNLVQVNVSFIGKDHVIVEETRDFGNSSSSSSPNRNGIGIGVSDLVVVSDVENLVGFEIGSPPDRVMREMYQYFANRTSPGASGERALRRQRRREKERQGRRKWNPEHLVKIVNCSPTPSRPLQGLWKGICDDMTLDFYHVAYDDIGGISCRRVGDNSKPFSGYPPVFWTSNATFIDSPLSQEEDYLYNTRIHLRPVAEVEDDIYEQSPSHFMYVNSSCDLVFPDLVGTSSGPRHMEGRIWKYIDGTFGFGFLDDNFIVDLKHIARSGHLLDTGELCSG